MEHVLIQGGLQPSTEVANAYLLKFCPHFSSIVCPFRDLAHVQKDFLWVEHTEGFTKAKELVSKAPFLRYFDVQAPVVLQVAETPDMALTLLFSNLLCQRLALK